MKSHLYDRAQTVALYLSNSNFVNFYKHCVLNGTELIELGFGQNVRPIQILSTVIMALNVEVDVDKKAERLDFIRAYF